MPNVQFKISSALKTIIGKELITDDFIAMFELVKNSFDANARRVDITFEALGTRETRIVIQDDGDGMDKDDIVSKWLFVAYSAKKKQEEDYRDKIGGGRIFAGAKGIGRFSCDRLGESLTMYTKRKGQGGSWHVLEVDWSKFEVDAEKEFQNIPAHYSTNDIIPYDLRHGTVLEIKILRSNDWNREKLLKLRRSLERLVNPNQENDSRNFQIHLHCLSELPEDKRIHALAGEDAKEDQAWKFVNGPVGNFVFESLGLKTAQILVDVNANGTEVHTCLTDRGRRVYDLVERNQHSQELAGVRITLFALNQASKNAFARRMGMRVHDYGSVFLYKNGFRIHPFGNPGDDHLQIDHRHQQGYMRTLGTRDLSGRIEINGLNNAFQETSSRDGGLIKNKAFADLLELIEVALKRLENFVIDLAKFGTERGELPDAATMSKSEVKQAIFEIITKLTRSRDVISVDYDPDFLDILQNRSAESVSALLVNLRRLAAQENSPELAREVSRAEKQLKKLTKAKEEAEAGEARERQRAQKAEKEARESQERARAAEETARCADVQAQEAQYHNIQLDTQNIFLKSVLSKDLEHILSLHHSIGQDAQTIEQLVFNLLGLLKADAPPRPEQMKVWLERISYRAKRITAITRFATQANHRSAQEETPGDMVECVREYLLNVYHGQVLGPLNHTIPIRFHQPTKATFETTFAPIGISIVFDNLISNARKTPHKVTHIDVSVVECTKERLVITFADDGVGIPKRNLPHLFEVGFSTTDGSGLGLHHVRETMTEMGGTIEVNAKRKQGAEFVLTFNKQ